MSVYTGFHAFDKDKADSYWEDFANLADELSEGKKNALSGTELAYYIEDQSPIETEANLIFDVALADLSFGGPSVSINEGDSFYINELLAITFPDLNIDEDGGFGGVAEETWIHIFDNKDSIKTNLEKERYNVLLEFLDEIEPIINACREENTRLILVTEGEVEDKELLNRAQRHIADIRGLPIMGKVFGDLNLDDFLNTPEDELTDFLFPGRKEFNRGEFESRGWKMEL